MTAHTTQITIRIPTPLVEYVDTLVREGRAKGRAAAIATALEHERQRVEDEREVAEFIARQGAGADTEMKDLADASWKNLGRTWSGLDR